MSNQVEEDKAKAAGIVSILIGICALIELICGFIYLSKGGPEGSGLWSGFGVNKYCYVPDQSSTEFYRWFRPLHSSIISP